MPVIVLLVLAYSAGAWLDMRRSLVAVILGLALILACAFLPGGGRIREPGPGQTALSVFYVTMLLVPGVAGRPPGPRARAPQYRVP